MKLPKTTSTSVAILALISLALLSGLFAVKWLGVKRMAMLALEVDQLSAFDALVDHASNHVLSMQSARRAFALTGEARFVRAFDDATRDLHERLTELAPRTQADAALSSAIAADMQSIRALSNDYEAQLRESMQVRLDRPGDEEAQVPLTLSSDLLSQSIRAQLLNLIRSNERRLNQQIRALVGETRHAKQTETALFFLGLIFSVGGFVIAGIELRRLTETRRTLQLANSTLQVEAARRADDLTLSEQRWRALVELSADAILVCSAQGLVEYANPAAQRLMQSMGSHKQREQSIQALLCGSGNAAVRARIDELLVSGGRMRYETASIGNGGAVSVQVAAVAYHSGDAVRAQIVIHDLTDLRTQEAATQDQLRFIEQLIEAIPLPLSVRDADGRFVRVNRAFERAHRCERKTLLGLSLFDLLPRAAATHMSTADSRARAIDRPVDYETRFEAPGGAVQNVLVRARAMRRDDGSLVGVVTLETDVTAMRRKEGELESLNAELSGMSARLIEAQESERRRISRELHDQVGQILTALKIQLGTLALRGTLDGAALAPARDLADEALRHARDLTASLHPHLLDDLGLEPALRWLLERFIRPTGLVVELKCHLQPARGAPAIELVAFRVVQEALTNVVRHARAASATVRLLGDGDGRLRVEVHDDGVGFDASGTWFVRQVAHSVGVAGMRERVVEAGGEFDIETAPGAGTRVQAILPW